MYRILMHSLRKKWLMLALAMVIAFPFAGRAQDEHPFTVNLGGGFTPLSGGLSHRLDNGWNVQAGAGFNITRNLSLTGQYDYNGLGVGSRLLQEAQVPNGNAHVWSVTANPKLRFRFRGVDPYIVGGVGYYRRVVEFTQPAAVPVTIFDPFFGAFFNTVIPADQVIGRITENGIGGSLGAGIDFSLGRSGLRAYTEARYHYADTGRVPTRMIPVTFGIRW